MSLPGPTYPIENLSSKKPEPQSARQPVTVSPDEDYKNKYRSMYTPAIGDSSTGKSRGGAPDFVGKDNKIPPISVVADREKEIYLKGMKNLGLGEDSLGLDELDLGIVPEPKHLFNTPAGSMVNTTRVTTISGRDYLNTKSVLDESHFPTPSNLDVLESMDYYSTSRTASKKSYHSGPSGKQLLPSSEYDNSKKQYPWQVKGTATVTSAPVSTS
jgi:hypothetical protein